MWRAYLIALLSLLAVGCGRQSMPAVLDVEVVQTQWEGESEEGWPSHIVLRVEVENPAARIAVLEARLRLSHASRRVAMLRLEEKVVVPARSRSVVYVPLHLAVQRHSGTLAFREALRERRAEQIAVDWEVALRSRMTYIKDEQDPRPIAEVLTQEQLEVVWEMIDDR